MTHRELVERAGRWLRGSRRCRVVLTEPSGTGSEIPDAIGWTLGYFPMSILVECKTSRADFLADRKKTFRDPRWGHMAVGRFRYFMTPKGLISAEELPPRWGLLEVREKSVRQVSRAKRWDLDAGGSSLGLRHEMAMILSELSKIQVVRAGGVLMPSRAASRAIELARGIDADAL